MNRRQICIIHGGTTFESTEDYRQDLLNSSVDYERLLHAPNWKIWLSEQLPDVDVLLPQMPNKQNAQYDDWEVLFEKILDFLTSEAILIGYSLGGIFLTKYFIDNPTDKKFEKIILVAPPYDDETNESLSDFKLSTAVGLEDATKEIHLLFSRDDPVVPISELDKYERDLPEARVHVFDAMSHFFNPEFPELLNIITNSN